MKTSLFSSAILLGMIGGLASVSAFAGDSANLEICTQGGSLGVRDSSLKNVVNTVADEEPVVLLSSQTQVATIAGKQISYVQVAFPKRGKMTGWVAQNYVKTKEQCIDDGLQDPSDKTVSININDLQNPDDWKRQYFDLVVVVNRNSKVQTLDAYYKGAWVKHTEVSSAVEATLHGKNLDGSDNTIFADTPVGYHTVLPGALQIDHHSKQFSESYMPFAVFYDQENGIATHEAPPGAEAELGTRASHGCVRMPREEAIDLFFTVAMTGGPVNIDNFGGECPSDYNYDDACRAAAATNTRNDRVLAQTALSLAAQKGMQPYSSFPKIPKITKYGHMMLDPATNTVAMESGYRTLYVIIDQPLAKGAVKIPADAPTALILGIPSSTDACVSISKKTKDTWGRLTQSLRSSCLYEPSGPPLDQQFDSFGNDDDQYYGDQYNQFDDNGYYNDDNQYNNRRRRQQDNNDDDGGLFGGLFRF